MEKVDREIYIELGQKLREAREKKGYSLEFVAEQMGVSKKTVQRYETAASRVSKDKLEKLSKIVGLDSDVILNSALFNIISPTKRRVSFRKLVHLSAKDYLNLSTEEIIDLSSKELTSEDVMEIEKNPDDYDQNKVAVYESVLRINLNQLGFKRYEDAWYHGSNIFLGRTQAFSSTNFKTIEEYADAVAKLLIDNDRFDEVEIEFNEMMSFLTSGMNFEQFSQFYDAVTDFASFKSHELMGDRSIWQSKK